MHGKSYKVVFLSLGNLELLFRKTPERSSEKAFNIGPKRLWDRPMDPSCTSNNHEVSNKHRSRSETSGRDDDIHVGSLNTRCSLLGALLSGDWDEILGTVPEPW